MYFTLFGNSKIKLKELDKSNHGNLKTELRNSSNVHGQAIFLLALIPSDILEALSEPRRIYDTRPAISSQAKIGGEQYS